MCFVRRFSTRRLMPPPIQEKERRKRREEKRRGEERRGDAQQSIASDAASRRSHPVPSRPVLPSHSTYSYVYSTRYFLCREPPGTSLIWISAEARALGSTALLLIKYLFSRAENRRFESNRKRLESIPSIRTSRIRIQ